MNYLLLSAILFTGSFSLVAAPEINVTGNSITISDGDITPDLADFTDFGNQSICAGITTLTFTIENSGPDPLNVGSVLISGVDAADFSVVVFPAGSVSAGGTTTFQVTFNPASVGLKNAVITINNDDSDEAVYDFAIQGTGTDPEITITGNGNTINDGSPTPSGSNHTGFGPVLVCIGTTTRTYTISNSGTGNLVISAGGITLTGTHAFDYTIGGISLPASISPGGSTTFTVTSDPSGSGNRLATVNIANNDCSEAVYDFAIQTNGQVDATAPVAPTLSTVADECSVTLSVPTANDNCAGVVSGTTSTSFPITTQGTTIVTWTFNDGNGNSSTANQTVTITDVTAPTVPTLTDATGECSVMLIPPVTTDNCAGVISGTTSTVFPITTQGTTVVIWTFNDGNGNSSTANQTVTIADTTSPVVPSLSDVTGECSVTLIPPVTTDNCAGTVTGTTTTVFPITTQGTTTVTWLFDDGNGNAVTATQDVILTDTINPVVSNCPSTITETVNTANCSAVVSWTEPSVTDNCVGSPVLTASHNPGADFPLGTTAVTYMFDDGNGNSAACAFDVVVISNLNATATTDVDGVSIQANNSSGTYQWINCATMAAIPGATTQTFFPSANGNYAVIVTENGCLDTSACANVFAVGVNELGAYTLISAFPNPSGGLFHLSSSLPMVKLELLDLSGKRLLEETVDFQQIDLSQWQNGVYLLRVTTADRQETILRLVKE
ncbi:MAG: choice-of-anchor D domain-containing protein [Bacteroidota bacterium]